MYIPHKVDLVHDIHGDKAVAHRLQRVAVKTETMQGLTVDVMEKGQYVGYIFWWLGNNVVHINSCQSPVYAIQERHKRLMRNAITFLSTRWCGVAQDGTASHCTLDARVYTAHRKRRSPISRTKEKPTLRQRSKTRPLHKTCYETYAPVPTTQ